MINLSNGINWNVKICMKTNQRARFSPSRGRMWNCHREGKPTQPKQWFIFFSFCFCSDQFLCKIATPRAVSVVLGSAVDTVNDHIICDHSSLLLKNCLVAPWQSYRGTCLFSNSSGLSGWASWCSVVTFVHISCHEKQPPFSKPALSLERRNYSDNRAVIRAQYTAYPTTQTNAEHVGCFSHMQIPGGFREAIHFRHHLVSWPISKATVCPCVFA